MYALNKEGGSLLCPMDVCQTPTPAGEVPVPYPNIGEPPMGEPGCENVLICGAPALNKATTIPETNGDQAGVGGGVVSGEIMGEAKFIEGSVKVRFEGSPAVCLTTPTTHNSENGPGSCVEPSQFVVDIME